MSLLNILIFTFPSAKWSAGFGGKFDQFGFCLRNNIKKMTEYNAVPVTEARR